MCFICVCGRTILNTMIEDEFHDFDMWIGSRDRLFRFRACFG